MRRRTFLLGTLGATIATSLRASKSLGTIAYVEFGGLTVRTLPDGEPRKVLSAPVSFPRFSPSGKWILYRQNDVSYVVSIDGKRVHRIGDAAAWSPVADELWAGGEDSGHLELFSARNDWSAPLATIPGASLGIFSPGGSEMIYNDIAQTGSGDELAMSTNLCRVALKDGARPSVIATTDGDWGPCLWTRDGKSVVFWGQDDFSASEASDGNQLYLMPANGGKAQALGVMTLIETDLVALSPSRNELAITAGDGRYEWVNKRLAVVDLGTAAVRYLMDNKTVGFSPAWSPDGSRIAYSAGPAPKPEEEEDLEGGNNDAIKRVEALFAQRRIWVTDRMGAQPARAITSGENFHDESPMWSGDGEHILFVRSDSSDARSLWLVGQDGSNAIRVTGDLYIDPDAGGPDERRAAFDWLR